MLSLASGVGEPTKRRTEEVTMIVKGFTGADIQAAIDAAKPINPQAPGRVVTLPAGEYVVTEPIRIEHAVRLEFDGAWLKATGEAAIVIEGNAAQLSVLRHPWIYGYKLKRGIVCHSSLVTIESPMVAGADVGILLESGNGKLLEMPVDSPDWFGCDHVRIRDVAIWDCVTGIRAHGSDTNNVTIHGVYGQTVTTLVDDNTLAGMTIVGLYHENGRANDLSDDPVGIHARSSAGATLAIGCGSDGPRFRADAGAVVVGAGILRGDEKVTSMTGNGGRNVYSTQFRPSTADGPARPTLYAGLGDEPSGAMLWQRGGDEPQVTGFFRSDDLGGGWPNGWHCLAYGPSRNTVSLAVATERATGRYPDGRLIRDYGVRKPVWVANGLLFGLPPEQSTLQISMGNAPPDGPAVEGDWRINTTMRPDATGRVVEYWRCDVGGDAPVWGARYGVR